MAKIIKNYLCFFAAFVVLSGCVGLPATQNVPVPKLGDEFNSAIIILKRQSEFVGSIGSQPRVYDNGTLIGELASGGELRWSRNEGTIVLDIKYDGSLPTHPLRNLVFSVEKNKVYTLNYSPSKMAIKLEGDELSQIKFTSSPPGAVLFAGSSPSTVKQTHIKTPFTMSYPPGSNRWAAEYYKMSLDGYQDSPLVFKNNTFGNREVHFDLAPLQVSKSNPDVAVNKNASPPPQQAVSAAEKPVQGKDNATVTSDAIKPKAKAQLVFPPILPLEPDYPIFTTNDIAIIIGIEKYRSVPPTEYAAADAGMVRDYLKALGISDRNIEFLSDDRATLSDIRKVIETKLPNMVKANSRVIVYYAGHGAPGTTKGESYLVPYDGDPSFLADTAYPLSRLYDRLSRLNAKEVLVILDSCFSGAGGRSVLAKNTRPLVMVKDTPPPTSKKMIVMTSSRGSQITTSLAETGHGAFTYFFLRALQEGNRDIGEVYAYLNPRVTEEAKRQNVDQTPTISPAADKLKGRFLFAR